MLPSLARVEVWKAAIGCSLAVHVTAIAAVLTVWPAADLAQFGGKSQVLQIEWTPPEAQRVADVQLQPTSPVDSFRSVFNLPQATLFARETYVTRADGAEFQNSSEAGMTRVVLPVRTVIGSGLKRRERAVDTIENKMIVDMVSPLAKQPTTAIPLPATTSPVDLNQTVPADFSSNPPPEYPAIAVRQRLEGEVLLEVYVDSNGSVKRVIVLRSSGHRVLDRAAVEAVQGWQGRPAMRGGEAIEKVERLPIQFKLL
jgi:TonB family protein